MDPHDARDDLEQAHRAYNASVQPVMPVWAPPVCGLLIAAAIALPGLAPGNIWWRLVTVAAGVVLAVLAGGLVLGVRARQGIRGVRGPARDQWTTLGVCGIAFLVSAVNSTPQARWIYIGLGIVGGVFASIVLRKARP